MDFYQMLEGCENLHIFDSFVVSKTKIERSERMVCSISGGSDSDIMLDHLSRLDKEKKVKYIFFNTGIEYEATKKHLEYLEEKYGIEIERIKAITPVPMGCRKYGLPFWSKFVSETIERLQRHGFQWEDKPFDELIKKYPKCTSALKWWCNEWKKGEKGQESKFNIGYTRGLKEFMLANPPTFRISSKCCNGAKKDNAKNYLKAYGADLNMVGIRKAEGGIRSSAYKTCFDNATNGQSWDNYRPIFWYTDEDKDYYEQFFDVKHSDCYSVYGLKRTGCAGCPFGKNFEHELEICKVHEPKLYKAINNIFGESYEYTRAFLRFRQSLFISNGEQCKQMTIEDFE